MSLAAMCAGCAARQSLRIPIVSADRLLGTVPAVHVENWAGNVRVNVDETLTEPRVDATLHGVPGSVVSQSEGVRPVLWIGAEVIEQDGHSILRILSQKEPGADRHAATDLVIALPRCQGTLIRNGGGDVTLVGVSGAVQVENGLESGRGGRIELRTDAPIAEPILLANATGDIHFQVSPAAAGQIDAGTSDGRVRLVVRAGSIRNVIHDPSHWSGTLNGGTNPVTLRTRSGNIRLVVMPGARRHVPAHLPLPRLTRRTTAR